MQGSSEFLTTKLHSYFASYAGVDDYLHQILEHFEQNSCLLSEFLCSLYGFRIAVDVTFPTALVTMCRAPCQSGRDLPAMHDDPDVVQFLLLPLCDWLPDLHFLLEHSSSLQSFARDLIIALRATTERGLRAATFIPLYSQILAPVAIELTYEVSFKAIKYRSGPRNLSFRPEI